MILTLQGQRPKRRQTKCECPVESGPGQEPEEEARVRGCDGAVPGVHEGCGHLDRPCGIYRPSSVLHARGTHITVSSPSLSQQWLQAPNPMPHMLSSKPVKRMEEQRVVHAPGGAGTLSCTIQIPL